MPARKSLGLTAFVAWLLATSAAFAPAQSIPSVFAPESTSAPPPSAVSKPSPLSQKSRETLAEQIAQAQNALDQFRESRPDSPPPKELVEELEILKFLELLHSQYDSIQQLTQQYTSELQNAESELESLRTVGPTESRPYSFLILDEIRDELAGEQARKDSVEVEIAASEDLVDSLQETHKKRERQRRALREAVETADDTAERTALARQLKSAELLSHVAGFSIELRQSEMASLRVKKEITQLRETLLKEKIAIMQEDVVFLPDDLNAKQRSLEDDEQKLRQELAAARSELVRLEKQWMDGKKRLVDENATDEVIAEATDAWQLASRTHQEQIGLINQRLSEVVILKYLWQHRFDLFNREVPAEQLTQWRKELSVFITRVERAKHLIEARLDELRDTLATLEDRERLAAEKNPEMVAWLEFETQLIHRLMNHHSDHLVRLKSSQRFLRNFSHELAVEVEPQTASEWASAFWRSVRAVWNYELTAVEDRPITVGKLITGLLLLIFGFFGSRRLSRTFGRRVLPRFGLTEGVSTALQTIAFYTLLIIFAFIALELVNVPLTVFAFMGGAIAIGVGFGSQNILNNFISGLIILVERPIRVGDLVDIDGLYGTIEHVGARSTRVKTGSNLEIIVPNSKFLENNVTNWTLSDTRIRSSVCVGVAYGSPTRRVHELLVDIAAQHPSVLSDPAPVVLFKEFGDNSLNFEVHFWIRMRTIMQGEKVKSEMRQTVDEAFTAENITIAFPQRDIHLDTSRPIEVNLMPAVDESSALPSQKRAA